MSPQSKTPRLIFASIILLASPSFAQDATDGPPEFDPTPVCMTGSLPDVAQVRLEDPGKPFDIIVVRSDTGSLAPRGFQPRPCDTLGLAEDDEREIYRDMVCRLSSEGNDAVQNQLESALGVRPAVLCANAEIIAGPWVRQAAAPETSGEGE